MQNLIICYDDINNWGDALNGRLAQYISGEKVYRLNTNNNAINMKYYCIGSILQYLNTKNFEIWGSGFIKDGETLKRRPNKIHAVRGPLTRNLLLKQGFDCPEIFGDPALLYPRFYKPNVIKKYKYGIIPHYVDLPVISYSPLANNSKIKIINVCDTVESIIDQVNQCEAILSSSLHGLIIADAYDIPAKWVECSNMVGGDGTKFEDYFLSIGMEPYKPIKFYDIWDKDTEILRTLFPTYKKNIDLNKLWHACPFKNK